MSPYTSESTNTVNLNQYTAQAAYLTSIKLDQKFKLPFLVGFNFVALGADGYNNSGSRNPTPDLNACYYLTTSDFLTSKTATLDFYFADLNSYTDLDWTIYFPNAIIFKDRDSTTYKVSDIKGFSITDRTTIRVRLDFDILSPFLGFASLVQKKKLLRLAGAAVDTESVSHYGRVYRYDKFLKFGKNSFFTSQGDILLCP